MKTAGEYALLVANGVRFADVVKQIRDEQALYLRTDDGRDLRIQEIEDQRGFSNEWTVWTDGHDARA